VIARLKHRLKVVARLDQVSARRSFKLNKLPEANDFDLYLRPINAGWPDPSRSAAEDTGRRVIDAQENCHVCIE
jgi:hypothetical protein